MSGLQVDKAKLKKVCRENDISYLGLFGSHARGDSQDDSDVDLLVEFSKRKSLFTLGRAEQALSELLGKDVDLVSRGFISRYIKDSVEEDLRTIYEEK